VHNKNNHTNLKDQVEILKLNPKHITYKCRPSCFPATSPATAPNHHQIDRFDRIHSFLSPYHQDSNPKPPNNPVYHVYHRSKSNTHLSRTVCRIFLAFDSYKLTTTLTRLHISYLQIPISNTHTHTTDLIHCSSSTARNRRRTSGSFRSFIC